MSNANLTAVRLVDETVAGTTPATPRFETLRVTAINLNYQPVTVVSEELVSDRNVTDLIRVGIEAGGDLPMETSYGAIHRPIRLAMQNSWLYMPVRDNDGTAASKISAVSGTLYTISTTPGTNTEQEANAFALGHLVYGTGFAVAANNGLKKATAAAATTVTCSGLSIEATPPAAARLKCVGFEGASGDITATTVTSNALLATTLNFTTLGLSVGMWLKVGGTAAGTFFSGTAANNGWVRISAIAAGRIDLDVVPTGWTTDAGAGKTIQVFVGDAIRNGTTSRSCSIEVEYSDLTVPEYDYYVGMRCGSMTLSAETQSIFQSAFSFEGFNASNTTTRFSGATTKAAPTDDVINTSSNVGQLLENGAAIAGPNYVMGFSVKLDNGLRRRNAIGTIASVDIALSRAQVSGTITTYYGSNTIRTKILAGTATSFTALLSNPAGTAGYHVDIPKLKFESGSPKISGVDTDRTIEAPFRGLKHATLGYAIQVSRFDYLPV